MPESPLQFWIFAADGVLFLQGRRWRPDEYLNHDSDSPRPHGPATMIRMV